MIKPSEISCVQISVLYLWLFTKTKQLNFISVQSCNHATCSQCGHSSYLVQTEGKQVSSNSCQWCILRNLHNYQCSIGTFPEPTIPSMDLCQHCMMPTPWIGTNPFDPSASILCSNCRTVAESAHMIFCSYHGWTHLVWEQDSDSLFALSFDQGRCAKCYTL